MVERHEGHHRFGVRTPVVRRPCILWYAVQRHVEYDRVFNNHTVLRRPVVFFLLKFFIHSIYSAKRTFSGGGHAVGFSLEANSRNFCIYC